MQVKIVKLSGLDIQNCIAPSRFFGQCHERCQKVHYCNLKEGLEGRIKIAKKEYSNLKEMIAAKAHQIKDLKEQLEKMHRRP